MATTQQIYQFRSQFSEFDQTADADVANALNAAALWVDPLVWSAKDYPQAVLYWAAHFLSLWLLEKASVSFGGSGDSSLFISSIEFGERRVDFDQRSGYQATENSLGPGEQLLMNTLYGQLYLQLRARNIIPIGIV